MRLRSVPDGNQSLPLDRPRIAEQAAAAATAAIVVVAAAGLRFVRADGQSRGPDCPCFHRYRPS